MKVYAVSIANFRGVREAKLVLPDHAVLTGDNNTGKSSVLEALDLVLGPDRLYRRPPVDEHDFYRGAYLPAKPAEGEEPPEPPKITIEATITALSADQQTRFAEHIEWLSAETGQFYTEPNPAGVDAAGIAAAIRVTFLGQYSADDDDFIGETYFSRSLEEDDEPTRFSKKDKQHCGYLFLRSLRTGSRALSLEHGSLLDIILRLQEIRPQMWEGTLGKLAEFDVASDPKLGISGILESINASLKKYVPKEWGAQPHLKVSSLTREHLRKVVTAFMATGVPDHAAPYFRQGTGTINMLVLAMLSQIAEKKQNVIFAMEEVETAIPPYAQKRIVHELRKLASQSIVTSHSPYVMEEFGLDETVILSRSGDGALTQAKIELPESIKHKRYRQEFRTRFCEGLLSRRIFIAEGATEASAYVAAARRLSELKPGTYASFEALGLSVIDAGTDSQIAVLAALYRKLGKRVFAACDKQEAAAKLEIEAEVEKLFMHDEHGLEDLVLNNTTAGAMGRFIDLLKWPQHLLGSYPNPKANPKDALKAYFGWSKGNWGIADFLAQCTEDEIPAFVKDACIELKKLCDPPAPPVAAAQAAGPA